MQAVSRGTPLLRSLWRQTPHQEPRLRARRLSLEALEPRELLAADFLYIGDAGTDSVQRFDADTGAYLGSVVAAGSAGLHGPRGMVFSGDNLLVVNQNVGMPFNGEVLRFDNAGAPRSPLVAADNPEALFAPRGMALRDNVLYVADFEGSAYPRVAKFNATTGAFLGEFVPSGFDAEFRPRGLVFGPDGGLYVSVFSEALFSSPDPAGYILRFDVASGASRVVARNDGDGTPEVGEAVNLHNPEGLVFAPDGRIYVTSNWENENTHILVIDPASGQQLDDIVLDPQTRPDNPTRISAQAIVFGPAGKLFIPITEASLNDGTESGGVWTYDPASQQTASFVATSVFDPLLLSPWYLTFGQTDPATLAYPKTVNSAPSLSGIEATPLGYAVNETATAITRTLTVSDSDSTTLSGAVIRISANYRSNQDVLSFTNSSSIQGDWDSVLGTLTLVGNASVANYQAALRSVKFRNTSTNPISDPRTIEFQVNDGQLSSNVLKRDISVSNPHVDNLFIGDQGDLGNPNDDTVKKFDLKTGALLDTWSAPGRLFGPRGMVFDAGDLLVVNQNVGTSLNGEVLRFDGKSGSLLSETVPANDPQAPFAPARDCRQRRHSLRSRLRGSRFAKNCQIRHHNSGFPGRFGPPWIQCRVPSTRCGLRTGRQTLRVGFQRSFVRIGRSCRLRTPLP